MKGKFIQESNTSISREKNTECHTMKSREWFHVFSSHYPLTDTHHSFDRCEYIFICHQKHNSFWTAQNLREKWDKNNSYKTTFTRVYIPCTCDVYGMKIGSQRCMWLQTCLNSIAIEKFWGDWHNSHSYVWSTWDQNTSLLSSTFCDDDDDDDGIVNSSTARLDSTQPFEWTMPFAHNLIFQKPYNL